MAQYPSTTQLETWANQASHTAGDPGAPAALKQVLGSDAEIITPYHFGADPEDPDWSVLNRTAVQAMLDEYAGSWSQADWAFKVQPHLCFRSWNVGDGVCLTNIPQPGVRLMGGWLIGSGAGTTTLDLSGTNSPELWRVGVRGSQSDPPALGILTSRTEDIGPLAPAPYVRFFGVDTAGEFSAAGHVALANEVSFYSGCAFGNDSRLVTARGHVNVNNYQAVLDSIGPVASCSDLPDAGVPISNLMHSYSGTRFVRRARLNTPILALATGANPQVTVDAAKLAASGLADGEYIWISVITGADMLRYTTWPVANVDTVAGTFDLVGADTTGASFVSGAIQNRTGPAVTWGTAHGVTVEGAYALAYGSPAIDLDFINAGPSRGFRFHGQVEHSPLSAVQIRNPATTSVWTNPYIRLTNEGQANAIATVVATGSGQVQIRGSRAGLTIDNMGTVPANGMLHPPGKFALKAGPVMEAPKAAALPDPDALAVADAVFVGHDRVVPTDDRRAVQVGTGVSFGGHAPGTHQNYAFTTAGPHVMASLPDSVTVQVGHAGIVEVQLPTDLAQGQTGTLTHTATSGYSYLSLAAGAFAGGVNVRTVNQYGAIGWQCIGNPGGAPVVKLFGGEPLV